MLGHYEILRLLGKGGMGEVWRARDTRLKREVALKVLPAEVAKDPSRLARFQQEAETVARLNHAHIVTLHSVEEDAGVRFLTMELVEGESLDQIIDRGGLPLDSVFQIGTAVADALATAHEEHVVHRDLKPANIMVSKAGVVKVLDFGLAKLTVENSALQSIDEIDETRRRELTRQGTVMGTVPYMSPEQARGLPVDHRSDIFSLGIVLYELATGQRPFRGATMSDLSSAILRDTPPPVTELRPELPHHLGRIIAHCLEKDPDQRTQSARDIRNELRSLRDEVRHGGSGETVTSPPSGPAAPAGTPRRALWMAIAAVAVIVTAATMFVSARSRVPAGPPALMQSAASAATVVPAAIDKRSIAVLPFVNMSSDKDQEYFSDGISEELLNLLAKIPELRVAARTSSFSFKGKNMPIPEIGKQLNVSHVLEGSVRRSGDKVRITAQLIHADDGYHLWSETWDRTLDDIFAVQDEIAADVVRQLQVTMLGSAPKVRKTDPEAYALYLQARALSRQGTPEAMDKADGLLNRALEIDPRYAPAWNGLAVNAINRPRLGVGTTAEGVARARAATAKALEADPENAPAHAGLGFIALLENDIADAATHLERALALDPSGLGALSTSATLLYLLGRINETLAIEEFLCRRDPVNPGFHTNLASSQIEKGRFDEAIASLRTALSLSPGRGGAHSLVARALLLKGDARAALTEVEKEPSELWRMITLPMIYHALGRRAESDEALGNLIARYEKDGAFNIAYVYAYRGERDRAFEWLDKAIAYQDPGLGDAPTQPFLASLHSDPRWLPFLRRIGKAPEQLAKIRFKVTLPPE